MNMEQYAETYKGIIPEEIFKDGIQYQDGSKTKAIKATVVYEKDFDCARYTTIEMNEWFYMDSMESVFTAFYNQPNLSFVKCTVYTKLCVDNEMICQTDSYNDSSIFGRFKELQQLKNKNITGRIAIVVTASFVERNKNFDFCIKIAHSLPNIWCIAGDTREWDFNGKVGNHIRDQNQVNHAVTNPFRYQRDEVLMEQCAATYSGIIPEALFKNGIPYQDGSRTHAIQATHVTERHNKEIEFRDVRVNLNAELTVNSVKSIIKAFSSMPSLSFLAYTSHVTEENKTYPTFCRRDNLDFLEGIDIYEFRGTVSAVYAGVHNKKYYSVDFYLPGTDMDLTETDTPLTQFCEDI